jgi:hypothetical protein
MPQKLRDGSVDSSVDSRIRDYVSKRGIYEDLSAQTDEAKRHMEAAKQELWDLLESEDLKTVHHALGRITRSTSMRGLVKDYDALMSELDDLGLRAAFTKISFRQRELNALVKERLNNGEELPAGLEPLVLRTITFAAARPAAAAMKAEE